MTFVPDFQRTVPGAPGEATAFIYEHDATFANHWVWATTAKSGGSPGELERAALLATTTISASIAGPFPHVVQIRTGARKNALVLTRQISATSVEYYVWDWTAPSLIGPSPAQATLDGVGPFVTDTHLYWGHVSTTPGFFLLSRSDHSLGGYGQFGTNAFIIFPPAILLNVWASSTEVWLHELDFEETILVQLTWNIIDPTAPDIGSNIGVLAVESERAQGASLMTDGKAYAIGWKPGSSSRQSAIIEQTNVQEVTYILQTPIVGEAFSDKITYTLRPDDSGVIFNLPGNTYDEVNPLTGVSIIGGPFEFDDPGNPRVQLHPLLD